MPTMKLTDLLFDGPDRARWTLILAHGAGAPMDSPFMADFSKATGERDVRVVRFEFPYMVSRRHGKRRPPDREQVLRACWENVVDLVRPDAAGLIIGGKSMGGRIASLVADSLDVAGLVCLGYPFHPPGKPEKTRTAHLEDLVTRSLFVQGTRDALGNREDVASYALSPSIEMHWIEDGDHSFVPRKSSGRTRQENFDEALDAVVEWIMSRNGKS